MEDKHGLYMVAIVGIVALLAIITMVVMETRNTVEDANGYALRALRTSQSLTDDCPSGKHNCNGVCIDWTAGSVCPD